MVASTNMKPGFSADRLSAYIRFAGLFSLVFVSIFFGAGALTVHFGHSIPMYLEWETSIPCVPSMVWIYLSAHVLWILPLVHLDAGQIDTLSRQVNMTTLLAGAGYLIFPGQLGYTVTAYAGINGVLIGALNDLAASWGYNLVPSLHVAYGTVVLGTCMRLVPRLFQMLYASWLTMLALSTILTHQHHLLDVVTGFGLGLVTQWLVPLKLERVT